MSVLSELDQIRSAVAAPGQPFELVDETVNGVPLKVYKNLPRNLTHFIHQASVYGERTFLVHRERRLSYAEALGRAAGLAESLKAEHGVGSGTRIAIAMRNSPEWIVGFLAILLAGGTAVLVNSRGTADEMTHAVHDTECMLLIADQKRAEDLAAGFGGPIIVTSVDGEFLDQTGRVIPIVSAQPQPSDAGLDDPAIIMFTSGTTGRPKGAVLTHRGVATFLFGMRHNGATYLARRAQKLGLEPEQLIASMPQQAALAIFPLFHVSGASAMLMSAVMNGGKLVFLDRWDPAAALEVIARERITLLQGPPSVFWDVLQCPGFAEADLSSITNVGVGGQATPSNLLNALTAAFPKAAPGGGFGQTETNGAIASCSGEEYLARPNAAGRLLPGVEVRILDEEGRDQAPDGVGEIWVRSALNMAGYWNQPEASAAVFHDGWLRTGDVGYVDADRFVIIVDRKKDVIIRGGENIYCAELERVFQNYPGVLEVAAFGVPDERWGERMVLAVVPHEGQTLDAEAMLAFGRDHLASYKIPSEVMFHTAPFVRNTVGKIDKAVLRNGYAKVTA